MNERLSGRFETAFDLGSSALGGIENKQSTSKIRTDGGGD